jgi:arylsulfatase A-like enzyme
MFILILAKTTDVSELSSDDRPNVIVVVTDDQGYGDLACHGNPVIETPEMDRLRAESARLTDFHVGTTCAPTRAQLMTGRQEHRAGVWHTIQGRSLLHPDETTMADVFSAAGYRTGIFGKWHLGDNYPYRPQERGFDEVLVHGGGGVAQTPDHWGNDYFHDTYFRDERELEAFDGYCTDVWFDEAMTFIESSAASDRPFFCYLPTNAAHKPAQVPESYRERYDDDVSEFLARFFGMITNIDDNLGRLRERLSDLGIAEDTVLVCLGDNGTVGEAADFYNVGMRGSKGSVYEGGHRVHCFLHWTGRIEATDVDTLAGGYDLLPTLTDLCEIEGPDTDLDGRSLTPALSGGEANWPERTLVVDTQRQEWPEKWRDFAVMRGQWRLVDGEELYDVEDDPGQEDDLSERYPEVVAELRSAYESWWAGLGDRLTEYCRITVGSDEEDPTTLTCHDWHGVDGLPWNQAQVLTAPEVNGFWTLDVVESGTYEFDLRRWPRECGASIDEIPDDFEHMCYGVGGPWEAEAESIEPVEAAIEIAGTTRTKAVSDGDVSTTFEVDLEPGPVELETQFRDEDGMSRGAYYVYVTAES